MQGLCSSELLAEFSDTCSFTTQAAQVVKFRTAYAATASNFEFLDFRRVYRECTLDSHTVGNFTHFECFGNASATAFDHNPSKTWIRSRLPSTIRTCTRTVSPALNCGRSVFS